MQSERFSEIHEKYRNWVDEIGSLLIEAFHYLALFVIGASILWSAVVSYSGMM